MSIQITLLYRKFRSVLKVLVVTCLLSAGGFAQTVDPGDAEVPALEIGPQTRPSDSEKTSKLSGNFFPPAV